MVCMSSLPQYDISIILICFYDASLGLNYVKNVALLYKDIYLNLLLDAIEKSPDSQEPAVSFSFL